MREGHEYCVDMQKCDIGIDHVLNSKPEFGYMSVMRDREKWYSQLILGTG